MFLDILFGLKLDRTFQYLCPPGLAARARPGMRVVAPFRGRPLAGMIVGTGGEARVDRVLEVMDIPDEEPLLPPALISLVEWVGERYLCPPGLALRAALTRAVLSRSTEAEGGRLHAALAAPPPETPRLGGRQREVLKVLGERGELAVSELLRRTGADHRTLRAMEKRGLVKLRLAAPEPPAAARSAPPAPRLNLAPQRPEAAGRMAEAMSSGGFRQIILHGPPGSGKLESFLEAARSLPPGRALLVVVPELSMTPGLLSRFEDLFPGGVAEAHGSLTEAQRARLWRRCRRGGLAAVVGSRSSLFLPIANLGAIFLDEEQEPSYKSETAPRYHAREVALARGRLEGLPVVLSSSAPSLETLAGREEPGVLYLQLARAAGDRGGVSFRVVDLRRDRPPRGAALSGPLRYDLKTALAGGRRSLLFVNRLGIASALFCSDCFHTPRCPECAIPLALFDDRTLVCRMCGHREGIGLACPRCGGNVAHRGTPGTRGVAAEVAALAPGARVAVMDSRTTSRGGEAARIISSFARGEIDVLVGTQVMARGITWPGLALVGVVDADAPLERPDFRAPERTYQLLAQVTGRAGHGPGPAKVVIQTSHPEHYALQAIVRDEPELFYRQETALRREAGFPPFSSLVLVALENRDERQLDARAASLGRTLEGVLAGAAHPVPEMLGPHPAPMARLRGRHRRQILVRGTDGRSLRLLVAEALRRFGSGGCPRGEKLGVDVDPVDFL